MSDNAALVIKLDKERMEAMVQGDTAKLNDMLCDNLVYTHATGRIDTKSSLVNDIESGVTVCHSIVPSDVKAQDLGKAVVLTGNVEMGAIRNGTLFKFSARFTDVYQMQDGTWRMVAWQSTKISH